LIPIDSPLFWLLAIIGVLLTGISKSGLAGGAGVLAVPLLALQVPVPVAVAITLPLLWLMDIKTVYNYRDAIKPEVLLRLCPPAFIGVAIGGWLLGEIEVDRLELLLGVLSILFASWQSLTYWFTKFTGAAVLWGMLAGLFSTLLHAGGPPLSVYFLGNKTTKRAWLGTAAFFFGLINLVKAVPYTLNNQWSMEQWQVSLLLLPVAWLGVKLGIALAKRINQARFTLIARSFLALAGVLLIYKGLL